MRRSKKKPSNSREAVHYPKIHIERLGNLIDEIELKERASRGEIEEVLPLKAKGRQRLPADFVAEQDLIEASPMPLSAEGRSTLIRAGFPRRPARKIK